MARPHTRSPALWRSAALAFLSYSALSVALTYPLVRHLTTGLPAGLVDPILNTWILWWNTQVVPFSAHWWNAPVFYPTPSAAALSEHLVGIGLLATPLYWATASPVAAYNVAFLLSIPLSGLTAFLLGHEFTGRRDAAWIAGLAYAFCPYRIDQVFHLQVLSSYWMPLALVGLHRFVREKRNRWLALFGVSTLMQGLCNGYYLMFFPVLIGAWLIWFVPIRDWRTFAAVGLTWIGSVLPVAPVLLTYRSVHDSFGLVRSLYEIRFYSADVTGLLSASRLLGLWGFLDGFVKIEGQLFPGATVVLLILVGLARARWTGLEPLPRPVRWLRRAFAVIAACLLLALLLMLLIGPWRITVLGLPIVLDSVDKPLSEALVFLAALGLTSRVVVSACNRGAVFAFYVLAVLVVWILTLGPFPTFNRQPFMVYAPYFWLLQLPGFDALRVPARFWMVAVLCLSMAASLAFGRVAPVRGRWRALVTGLVAAGMLADGWTTRLATVDVPSRSPILERAASGPVIELPLGNPENDTAAMYRSMYHGRPVANGYSGYAPPHYPALVFGLETADHAVLAELARLDVRDVLVNHAADRDGGAARFVASYSGVAHVVSDEAATLYRLPAAPARPESPLGADLPIARLEASVNAHLGDLARDGDLSTRWTSGPQREGHEVIVELATASEVGAVVLELGPSWNDFPRSLEVDVSEDGQAWVEAWRGPTAAYVLAGALRDPLGVPIVIELGRSRARFIRLRQLGSDPTFYWSIAELSALSPRPGL